VHLKHVRSHSVMLPRGDNGNGNMSLNPFTAKVVIERRSNFRTYELFVDTYFAFIISLISDGVIGIFH
jgi:hypothetical protein